jgi:hypothetical protein
MEMGKEDGRYVNPKTFTSDLFFLSFPYQLASHVVLLEPAEARPMFSDDSSFPTHK